MSFLGPVGSLIPVKCASRITVAGGREVSFTRTLGKQKAFLGRVTAREWSVDIGLAEPQELSGLRWLAENVNAPMVWYAPDAIIGNSLRPQQADLVAGAHNGLEGPLVEVEPGLWVKSVTPDTGNAVSLPGGGSADHVPVVSGMPVTVSVWLRGNTIAAGQTVFLTWYDHDGGTVTTENINVGSGTTGLVRRQVTRTPPVGAVRLGLAFYAEQIAGPAVTLTNRLMPYSPGKGAYRVVAHDLASAVIRATDTQQYESLTFTVSEVG